MSADFDLLASVAEDARLRPGWDGYATYAKLRSRGLRADALRALDGFIREASPWPFDERLAFCRWLLEKTPGGPWARTEFLPQPLYDRIAVPTLREWSTREPQSAEAHLWLGLLGCDNPMDHLVHALDLDPSCEVARWTLVEWIISDVAYNQHHLPALYIHDPRDDLPILDRAQALLDWRFDHPDLERLRRELPELRRRAEDWLAAHPREGDFADH